MGLLSLFRKPKPEEVLRSIVTRIVSASLFYRKELAHPNDKRSADAGAELAYLQLHLVDREIFHLLGASRRDAVFDQISQNVIADYVKAVLRPKTPQSMLFEMANRMQSTLNSRQMTYSKCRSILGDQFPSAGTMVFAFCFFVRRALGHTTRTNVDDILAGKGDIRESDLSEFPDVETVVRGAILVGSTLKTLRIENDLKHLR